MTAPLLGALLGLMIAIGVLIAVYAAPPMRPIRLDDRLSPYLRDAPPPSRLLIGETAPTRGLLAPVRRLLGPILQDAIRVVDRFFGGRTSVRRRLAVLGNRQSVEDFRIEQVLWGAVGLAAGAVVTAAFSIGSGRINVLSALLFCAGGILGGVLGRDWALSNQVSQHEQAIMAEFPVVAELLALSVTAGEGPTGAIDRVCRLTGGALATDLADALARARAGMPLVDALQQLADRTNIESLARFVDGLIVAIERGTPLADVLRAQAADVREAGKRALLEAGGKKEIGMMVPVVFLVLPVTVLFALYPGLFSIEQLAR
ncbi:MAG TPA: type II secretion system F family protein [Mycobacteriales bacterium]|nr:type II secretion system F family protein [Mycobacteriales bacterium]